MRYRQLTSEDDYDFGSTPVFLVNTPETVAQAVLTRLRLYAGEWFLDKREGLDLDQVLGYGTQDTRDFEIQRRIAETPGVTRILSYSSDVAGDTRNFSVLCGIDTVYGQTTIQGTLR